MSKKVEAIAPAHLEGELSVESRLFKGIVIPPLPSSEIPVEKPDLDKYPKPESYPWIHSEQQLNDWAVLVGQGLAGVDLVVTEPSPGVTADFAMACHRLAKPLRLSPGEIAAKIASEFNSNSLLSSVKKAEATASGYVNFELEPASFSAAVIKQIEKEEDAYGHENLGEGKTIVIDCSSPNIAKYMSVGHLRSTVIGESLGRIYKAGGYNVIRDNHLGDWGTQFGILATAKELWGEEIDREMPDANPVKKLYTLYVRMSDEIAREKEENNGDSALENEGRKWFKRLEEGDSQAKAVLKEATSLSLREFKEIYTTLGVEHEYTLGESYYVPMLDPVTKAFVDKGLATIDETEDRKGALVVKFPEESHIRTLILRKSDGASVYATREFATLIARTAWFNPDKILYVVGSDQKEYFTQVFKAFNMFTEGQGPEVEHVYFGMINLPEGKMSTRRGRVVFLEDVLDEAIDRARSKILETKQSDLENGDMTVKEAFKISRQVGTGAVIYMDLGQTRERSIQFDWDKALSFEGNSSVYIQYAHMRGKSILRKAEEQGVQVDYNMEPEFELSQETDLIKHLAKFPVALAKAINTNEPSAIAAYTFKVADLFNKFYKEVPILREQDLEKRNSRLRLAQAAAQVIKNGLYLLGIEAPEKM
jgi:arginyl-tRNA synthetase